MEIYFGKKVFTAVPETKVKRAFAHYLAVHRELVPADRERGKVKSGYIIGEPKDVKTFLQLLQEVVDGKPALPTVK